MTKTFTGLIVIITLVLFLDSCKKDDSSFVPIEVENVEDKLVGKWAVIFVDAIGTVDVFGKDVAARGQNKGAPDGFYELSQSPNEYKYELKATLEMKAAGLSQDYDYDDKDAGTWSVSEDEKSVEFVGNQGITQTLFFTQYDSASTLYMKMAIPVDTTLKGFDYKGTVFINMAKSN